MHNSISIKDRPNGGKKSIVYSALILIIIGFGGYLLVSRNAIALYVLAHVGALGAIGLFAWGAGLVAGNKGRGFYPVFILACLLPIIAGICAVLLTGDSVTCGGSISLATAVLTLALITFIRKKE